MPNDTLSSNKDSTKFLITATVLTILISYLPYGWIVVYPIRLFVTFIHEGGHALAALATFGAVERIQISADGSGVTMTRGGLGPLISSAGYLTTTAVGASLLVWCSRGHSAKAVLTVSAALILVLTAFLAGDPFSWLTGILLAVGLIWAAIGLRPRLAHFGLSFLAVQCCLNALFDLRTLFLISATTDLHSDAVNMEKMTFIPAIVWAVVWIAISLFTLIFALKRYAEGVIRP
ncbi:MAG: M50 family metallopeptidase [Blastocatellia bacterium]